MVKHQGFLVEEKLLMHIAEGPHEKVGQIIDEKVSESSILDDETKNPTFDDRDGYRKTSYLREMGSFSYPLICFSYMINAIGEK